MPVRPLSPELAEKARLELNEDPKKLEDGIKHIKEWISKQPHLRARTDDQWLAAFLRGCKFSIERTKEKIDLSYSLRSTAPELYNIHHKDPKFKEILSLGSGLVLPKSPKPTDPRIVLIRPGLYDPAKHSITDVMSVMGTIMRILYVDDDAFVVTGGVNIMDLEGATMAHAAQATPALMKKMAVIGQDASPTRMRGTHYLNTPPGFETLLNIGKQFLNEKNRNRLHVHNKGFESLYKYVSQEVLPAEYGGQGGTAQEIIGLFRTLLKNMRTLQGTIVPNYKTTRIILADPQLNRQFSHINEKKDYWLKKVEEYSDWLDEEAHFGTDESKRPGKPKTAADMFGIDGSFRQLEFD